MSNKIQIELSDLEKQGQVLGSLASQMETLTNEFNNNANKMYDSLHGFTKINLTLQSLFAIAHSKSLTQELQFGSEVAQKCVEAYRAADQQTAKDINMNQTIIEVGGDSYHDQADSTSEQVIVGGNTKQYDGSGNEYKGHDYSNYKVISGFDSKFAYDQHNYHEFDKKNADGTPYKKSNGKIANEGCTETAEAMAYSMKHPDNPITPSQLYAGHKANSDGTQSSKTLHEKSEKIVDGSSDAMKTANAPTAASKRQVIYEQVNAGNPVVVRLGADRPKDGPGHDVLAVGIRDGADPNNLTNNDILCIDPADGKVKTLEECNSKVASNPYKFEDRGSLRISK